MTTLTIALPEPLRQFIDELVARGDFKDPSDYLQKLVDQDWLRRNQERIDTLLIEGLDSGPSTPFTARDWEEMRERLQERLASRGRA